MSHIHIMSLLKILKSHSKKLRRVTSPPYPTGAGRGGVGRGGEGREPVCGPMFAFQPPKETPDPAPSGKTSL